MALPTFAAECRSVIPCYCSPDAGNRTVSKLLLRCCNGTDRRTGTMQLYILRCTHYMGSANNMFLTVKYHRQIMHDQYHQSTQLKN